MDWQEERFNKWNGWLDDIYSDITILRAYRDIFSEVREIITSNPKIQKPSRFYDFFLDAYAALALAGVRRQIKIHKDSISLARLLEEIRCTPEVLSRTRFVALYPNDPALGDIEFDQFAGRVGSHVDPDLVEADLDALKVRVQRCEEFADRRIAHFDKRPVKNVPTFIDLDGCIDFLWGLMRKYYLLFRAISLQPVPRDQPEWKEIFREAWLPSESDTAVRALL